MTEPHIARRLPTDLSGVLDMMSNDGRTFMRSCRRLLGPDRS